MALTAFVLAVVVGGTFFAVQYRRTVDSNRMLRQAMTFLDTKAEIDTSNDARELEIAASLESALKDVRAYRSIDKNSRGRLAYSVGMRYIHLARYEEAQEALQLAETLYAAICPPEHENRLATQGQLGLAYFEAGQYSRALEVLEPAAALAQEHLGLSTSVTKSILNHLAITYGALGQYERQLEILETLHGAARETNQPEQDHQLLHNYAQVLTQLGRLEEAIQLYLEARTIFGEKDPRTLDTDKSLSVAYLNAGRIEEALQIIQRDLPICRELMGNDHRQTLMWENSLAGALLKSGRVAESVAVLRDLLPRAEKVYGAQHPTALLVAINLGGGYLRLGASAKAVAQFESAYERAARQLGGDHPFAIRTYKLLGQGLTEAGRYAEAEEVFDELLQGELKKPAPDLPEIAKHYWRLGINATLAEEPREAESHLERALQLLAEHEPDCWQVADVKSRLGALYCRRGDRDRGWPLVQEGRDLLRVRVHLISVPLRASTIAAAEARVAACSAEES
jgi:tetratricopeptide (TPR) repeat protein